jgi:hypothetical protein
MLDSRGDTAAVATGAAGDGVVAEAGGLGVAAAAAAAAAGDAGRSEDLRVERDF